MRRLCLVEDIPEGAARGFPPAPGGFTGLFGLRHGNKILIYVNACPHLGVALEWAPNRFLNADGTYIVCATHGALFTLADGACVDGPCAGDYLQKVPHEEQNGMVLVPDDAGL